MAAGNPLRPNNVWLDAVTKGLRAARQNLVPMLILEGAMGVLVAIYYLWPAGKAVLDAYAIWQHSGGVIAAALATGVAGGVISELSLVYFQDRGRWNMSHVENLIFKFLVFVLNGAVVYEFYLMQAFWFGDGNAWSVLIRKICVDQFGFTVIWSLPYLTFTTRWQALGYSGKRLWDELNWDFVTERMLPVLVTNWLFWIPGVSLVYSMPLNLQTPLFIFATAIWGILLVAVSRQDKVRNAKISQAPIAVHPMAVQPVTGQAAE